MVRKDRGCILFASVSAYVVSKNLNIPNLSPMADDAITPSSIPGLGFPLYICGMVMFFMLGTQIRWICYICEESFKIDC